MTRARWMGGALVLALLALGACSGDVERLTPMAAAAKVKAGQALLVDVREADEVEGGLAAPAQWYAISSIERDPDAFAQFLRANAKGREVIFYCAAGPRAQRAAERARALGYKTGNMGGFSSWVQAGLPVAHKK